MKKLIRACYCAAAGALLWSAACLSGCSKELSVRSGDLLVRFSPQGEICALEFKGKPVDGFTARTGILSGQDSLISARKVRGGWEFVKEVTAPEGRCRMTERFSSAEGSIRWDVSIEGDEHPWSAPLQTVLHYPAGASGASVWAPWGGPQLDLASITDEALKARLKLMPDTANRWINPLEAAPFTEATYYYGSPYVTYEKPNIAYCPGPTDVIALPMVSVSDPAAGMGLSVILSPEDLIQDITLQTDPSGTITFSRYYHRIVKSNPLRFSLDLVAHEPSWRSGLAWMCDRYADYFTPVNGELAFELNGTSAYSCNNGAEFDAQKMKDMAFSTNWRASFDFPYMGIFIPPVKDVDTGWKTYRGDTITVRAMNDYAASMKSQGFHVLSYFNLNEFGTGIQFPAPAPTTTDSSLWWQNSNDYLYGKLADAMLFIPEGMNPAGHYTKNFKGGPYYTWGDGVVMDCGVESYKQFLLEQARRHLDWLPDADGFCIDRYDWWHYFNEKHDDGMTWFEGKPVRSLNNSLRDFMKEFLPMVHEAGKVVYVNTHTKRLDLLKGIDGIHDEYTYREGALNTTAFLALKKPALGWTDSRKDIEAQGVDNFFQKYLLMGVYPMCPFPGNDHSIRPDEWVDQAYLDYGPLMKPMKYRTWVLSPDPVSVTDDLAKANVFEVPGGYIVPVVYATADQVQVSLPVVDPAKTWSVEAYYPGETAPVKLEAVAQNGVFALDVPVRRGCAMLRLQSL